MQTVLDYKDYLRSIDRAAGNALSRRTSTSSATPFIVELNGAYIACLLALEEKYDGDAEVDVLAGASLIATYVSRTQEILERASGPNIGRIAD